VHERPVKQKVIVQGVNLAILVPITQEMRQEPAAGPELFIRNFIRDVGVIVRHGLNEDVLQSFPIGRHLFCGGVRCARIDGDNARCVLQQFDNVFKVGRADRLEHIRKPWGRREIRLLEERAVGENLRAAGDAECSIASSKVRSWIMLYPFGGYGSFP